MGDWFIKAKDLWRQERGILVVQSCAHLSIYSQICTMDIKWQELPLFTFNCSSEQLHEIRDSDWRWKKFMFRHSTGHMQTSQLKWN